MPWSACVRKVCPCNHRWLVAAAVVWINLSGAAYAQSSQSLFTNQTPVIANGTDGAPYETGMKFQLARSGQITAVRYWKASGDGGTHVGRIWSSTGALLASVTFAGGTASGWQQQALVSPLAVQANTVYTVSGNVASHFPITVGGLSNPIVNGDIGAVADGSNGVFGTPGAFPTTSYQSSNYFRDIVFVPATLGPAAKLALTPVSTNAQAGNAVAYTATIQDVDGNPVTTATDPISFSVSGVSGSFNPTSPVSAVGGSATFNLTPTTAGTATISASATGLTSATATLIVSNPSTGSQSLFTAQTPALASLTDGVPYELGMKFKVARSGSIHAIRYWKASGDTGTHVGRIWSSTGALLASVTFTGESASGWQQQALSNPLSVNPNATYIVSVNIGSRYPITPSGLGSPIVRGDIGSVADSNNGVFGNPFAFPTNSYQSSNYFRDVVFIADSLGSAAKLALAPTNTNGQTATPIIYTATVQDANGNTVATATNLISFSVTGIAGSFSPASPISASDGSATSSFTPTTTGSGTVTASAQGLTSATAALAVSTPTTQKSLFTTQSPAASNVTDGVPYELGMKFRVARSGQIAFIRYWKSLSDSGTHVGRIWSATGALLASTPFINETASGWQQQSLEVPVPVQPNTTYTVSVNIRTHFPVTTNGLSTSIVNGDVSSVADGNNGVYGTPGSFPTSSYRNTNYFRDIGFIADSFGAPVKLALRPASASTQTEIPVSYTATIQDASNNTVSTAENSITFSVSGVAGTFNPVSPVASSAGIAASSFSPNTAGTATISASAAGLSSASAVLEVAQGSGCLWLFPAIRKPMRKA